MISQSAFTTGRQACREVFDVLFLHTRHLSTHKEKNAAKYSPGLLRNHTSCTGVNNMLWITCSKWETKRDIVDPLESLHSCITKIVPFTFGYVSCSVRSHCNRVILYNRKFKLPTYTCTNFTSCEVMPQVYKTDCTSRTKVDLAIRSTVYWNFINSKIKIHIQKHQYTVTHISICW